MPITPQQLEQMSAWMDEHFPDGLRCPLCQRDEWEAGEVIMGLWVDPAGAAQTEGPMNPMLQVRCLFCRHVVLFDAGPMGLAPAVGYSG